MFQLQELDLIKAAVDKLDHWEIVMPSATDDDELQFELTPSVSLYDAKISVSVTSFNAFAKEVVALADGFDPRLRDQPLDRAGWSWCQRCPVSHPRHPG